MSIFYPNPTNAPSGVADSALSVIRGAYNSVTESHLGICATESVTEAGLPSGYVSITEQYTCPPGITEVTCVSGLTIRSKDYGENCMAGVCLAGDLSGVTSSGYTFAHDTEACTNFNFYFSISSCNYDKDMNSFSG